MKKLLVASLAMTLAMGTLAGCASKPVETAPTTTPETNTTTEAPAETPADTSSEKIFIPVLAKGFNHQFWQSVKLGAEKAAADYGVEITFEGTETEAQVDKQLDMLDAALAKNPQAICFAALDSKAATPYLEKAQAAGIPVLGFDSGVDSEIVKTTCATDNYAAAAAAADKMAELIGGSGKIAVVAHDQTSTTGKQRRDGFLDRIASEYPNIEVVSVQYGEGDHAKSTEAAKAIITANPDIAGIYGTNEGSAVGVGNAIKELNLVGQLVGVGFDSGAILMQHVESGVLAGAITQDPIGMGYKVVEAAYKNYKGETTESFIDTGFKWYDASNMKDADIAPLLYE